MPTAGRRGVPTARPAAARTSSEAPACPHVTPTFRERRSGRPGLRDARRRAGRRRALRAADRARRQAPRRRDGADARLQRLDPGPTLRVRQGSEVHVDVDNDGDLDATVHWHGLRLENRYDGTHETQDADRRRRALHLPRRVPRPGRLLVPPAHPRGLRPGAGPVRQRPRRAVGPGLLAARNREVVLTLDDILLEDGHIAPFSRRRPTMRRWAASATSCSSRGEPELALTAQAGRGGAALPHEHRQHAGVQGRAPAARG